MHPFKYLTAVCLTAALLMPLSHTRAESPDTLRTVDADTREEAGPAAKPKAAAGERGDRKVHAVSGASMAKRRAAKRKKKQQTKN